jgi:hypothetical protein
VDGSAAMPIPTHRLALSRTAIGIVVTFAAVITTREFDESHKDPGNESRSIQSPP